MKRLAWTIGVLAVMVAACLALVPSAALAQDAASGPQPIYHFYNMRNGSHFYTASAAERDIVLARYPGIYAYQGESYAAASVGATGTVPVYRFYFAGNGSHFYTANAEEWRYVCDHYANVYTYEGIAYYVSAAPTTAPVYRFWDKVSGGHFYTASAQERDYVTANYSANYTYEGVVFWAEATGAGNTAPWPNPYGYPWGSYILIDKSDFRLYWISDGLLVKIYPIAHGREYGWTPNATWRIGAKYYTDPGGIYGPRKLRMYRQKGSSFVYTAYGIHGTNEPWVIGTMASHGCIRLYNEDILDLFDRVPMYTMVVTRD